MPHIDESNFLNDTLPIKKLAKGTVITLFTQVAIFILGLVTSITIARALGPEGKGLYSLAILFPALIITFTSFGIAPATAYYTAQRKYPYNEILGNNIILSLSIGTIAMVIGLIIIFFGKNIIFPKVNEPYLLLVLPLILLNLLFAYGQNILLGMQKIKKYNLITLGKNGIFLGCILVSVILFKSNIAAIILANVSAMCLSNALLLVLVRNSSKGAKFEVNRFYIKDVLSFGIKAHLGHILSFLNYRVDMLLINGLLNPTAVGFYSISVVIAEKLWWISQAASTVLFPQVASERDERIRKEITPIVSRNVLFVSLIGTVAIFFLSRWLVSVLYSNTFLPAVRPLQALLPGIVALSVSRVLANDIAGRGRPILNAYLDILTVATNVACNIWWIPRFGIEGAAWATTVSYSVHLVGRTLVYSKLSGNPIHKIFLLTSSDIILYKRVWLGLMRRWSSAWSR